MNALSVVNRLLEYASDGADDVDDLIAHYTDKMFSPARIVSLMTARGWENVTCRLAFSPGTWLLMWNSSSELVDGMPEDDYNAEADRAVKDGQKSVARACRSASNFEYYAPFTDSDFGLYFNVPSDFTPVG